MNRILLWWKAWHPFFWVPLLIFPALGFFYWAALSQNEQQMKLNRELVEKHCAATDIDGAAVIYTCEGGRHLVRYK